MKIVVAVLCGSWFAKMGLTGFSGFPLYVGLAGTAGQLVLLLFKVSTSVMHPGQTYWVGLVPGMLVFLVRGFSKGAFICFDSVSLDCNDNRLKFFRPPSGNRADRTPLLFWSKLALGVSRPPQGSREGELSPQASPPPKPSTFWVKGYRATTQVVANLDMSPPTTPLRVGGRWRLTRKIGSGSFGEIFLGTHITTGVEVAVKMEPTKRRNPHLIYEGKIMKTLEGRSC